MREGIPSRRRIIWSDETLRMVRGAQDEALRQHELTKALNSDRTRVRQRLRTESVEVEEED